MAQDNPEPGGKTYAESITARMNSPPQPENRNALTDETWFEASKIPTVDG